MVPLCTHELLEGIVGFSFCFQVGQGHLLALGAIYDHHILVGQCKVKLILILTELQLHMILDVLEHSHGMLRTYP